MRRESDRKEGQRTGTGRRARDRILAGNPTANPVIRGRYELQNLLLFLADDLRESALALGALESYLVRVQELVDGEELDLAALHELIGDDDVLERFDLLWDGINSLRRSMAAIRDSVHTQAGTCVETREERSRNA